MEVAALSRSATRRSSASDKLGTSGAQINATATPQEYYRLRRLHPFQYLALSVSRRTDDKGKTV